MRKNELINILSQIKGNPEIVIWNGFVGDYHKISKELVPVELVKHSREHLSLYCDDPEKLDHLYKTEEWELPNSFVPEEEYARWYGNRKKTVYVLNGKLRGKKYLDRLGTMEY